jgi:hypothetical protein
MSELLLARSAGTSSEGARSVPDDLFVQFDLLAATGALVRPAPHEIWFSSTDAAAPSLHAHAAGLATLARLMARSESPNLTLSGWFDSLRGRIAATFGPPGTQVFLAPSISSARDLARAIACAIHGGAARELSAGAAESHDMGETWDVALRLDDGRAREPREINHEALLAARQMSSPLLLHVLDQSRSGLSGLTRAGADAIASERAALTLIDATAMRTAPDCLRWDLEVGRLVLIAGSTFLGGHASSAAVLVPPSLAARMTHAVPSHFTTEASAHDMPPEWRDLFCAEGAPRLNIGLGLRWSAALAELDRYLLTPLPLREAILDLFARRMQAQMSRCDWIERIEQGKGGVAPLILSGATLADAQRLREALATLIDCPGDAVFHLGAPMELGADLVSLPLSASAPMVSDVAGRIAQGVSFERAFAPIQRDIDSLFSKMERVWG